MHASWRGFPLALLAVLVGWCVAPSSADAREAEAVRLFPRVAPSPWRISPDGRISSGGGGEEDLSLLAGVQWSYRVSGACPEAPELCAAECNLVAFEWFENGPPLGALDVEVDGETWGSAPGLAEDRLPGWNPGVSLALEAGVHTVVVSSRDKNSSAQIVFTVLDERPFLEPVDLRLARGATDELKACQCELLAEWRGPGPYPDEYLLFVDDALQERIPGTAFSAHVPNRPQGEARLELIGIKGGGEGVFYSGCSTGATVLLGCKAGDCEPPRELFATQVAYGPGASGAVELTWVDAFEARNQALRAYLDGALIAEIPAGKEAGVFGGLLPGRHHFELETVCEGKGESARVGTSLVVLATSPHTTPVSPAGVHCAHVEDDGAGHSGVRVWWTSFSPSFGIDVYIDSGRGPWRVDQVDGLAQSIFLRGAGEDTATLLTFRAWIGDGAYASPTLSCAPVVLGGQSYLPGACSGQGSRLEISSAIFGLDYLFGGGPDPPCFAACDVNGDALFNIADMVWVLSFLFLGGPPPAGWKDADGDGLPDPTCLQASRTEDCQVTHQVPCD